jgi:hypothetical protein
VRFRLAAGPDEHRSVHARTAERVAHHEATILAKTQPDKPRLSALIWTVLLSGALRPVVWLLRCRWCWRGRFRTVIDGHLRVRWVCPVCHATRPIPAWLQPSRREGNIPE